MRSDLRERSAGDALKSCWCTKGVPAENLSYSQLPLLQGRMVMRSRSPETEEGTWCRKLQWGYCSAGCYFGVRYSRVEGGCFDPREPCDQQPCIKANVPNHLRVADNPPRASYFPRNHVSAPARGHSAN